MDRDPPLDWGLLGRFDLIRASRIPSDLVRIWQVAQESLGLVAQPIERFELAGTLNGHPGHVRFGRGQEAVRRHLRAGSREPNGSRAAAQ